MTWVQKDSATDSERFDDREDYIGKKVKGTTEDRGMGSEVREKEIGGV